jgi:hypothetical protein
MANPVTATLAKLADAAAAGTIRVPIMRTYELEDVPSGFAEFAAGTLGKLAVHIQRGRGACARRQTRRATPGATCARTGARFEGSNREKSLLIGNSRRHP